MNDKYKTHFAHDKSSRTAARKAAVKRLIAEGHSRTVALKRAKSLVK